MPMSISVSFKGGVTKCPHRLNIVAKKRNSLHEPTLFAKLNRLPFATVRNVLAANFANGFVKMRSALVVSIKTKSKTRRNPL